MTPDPRLFPNTIRRKAEHDRDLAGAVCELVVALAFGLRRDYDTPSPHPGRGRSSTGRRNYRALR